jgi:hypothetical protein
MQVTHNNPSKKNPSRGGGGGGSKVSRNEQSQSALTTLFIFSIGMITMPLSAYCLARYLSDGSTTIGAFAAIVTVQLLLAAFVYKALTEPGATGPGLKED